MPRSERDESVIRPEKEVEAPYKTALTPLPVSSSQMQHHLTFISAFSTSSGCPTVLAALHVFDLERRYALFGSNDKGDQAGLPEEAHGAVRDV